MNKDINIFVDNLFTGLPTTKEAEDMSRNIKNQLNEKYDALLSEGKNEDEALGIICREFGSMSEIKYELVINEAIEEHDVYTYVTNKNRQRFQAGTGIFAIMIGLIFFYYYAYMVAAFSTGLIILLVFLAVGLYYIVTSTAFATKANELLPNDGKKKKKKGNFCFSDLTALMPFIYVYLGFAYGKWAFGWIIIPVYAIISDIVDKILGLN